MGEQKMKEEYGYKKCQAELEDGEVCGEDIEHLHNMYRYMGFCEKHYCENADALHEEWKMTGEVIGRW